MDGWTATFIVVFGVAAIIPTVWSIIGLIRGNTQFWLTVIGLGWGVTLLGVTGIGAYVNWGDCETGATSKDAVKCFTCNDATGCNPDLWKLECGQPAGCTGIPRRAFCPPGQKPTFPFCERIRFGASVKQPWATWSDLSFIAAGLWIFWLFQYFGRRGTGKIAEFFSHGDNPMVVIGPLSIAYGFIVIFMGPPSQWFHASIKDWAGWFDTMSVVFWLMFNGIYVFYMVAFAMWGRAREVGRNVNVLVIWVLFMIIFGVIGAQFPDGRLFLYFISGGLWGVMEIIYVLLAAFNSGVIYRRVWWLFVLNISLLAVTMTIWIFFNDNAVSATTCQANESFPGHALFHILASFSTILTFFSFASERRV